MQATGVIDLVKSAFSSVFNDANYATEAWYEALKFRTAVRDRYTDYIARTVGAFPLFGTTYEAAVASAYVSVGISSELERDRYRDRVEIERALTRQRDAQNGYDRRHSNARELVDVIDGTTKSLALIGLPGSGKTTVLRHLALEAAKGRLLRNRRVIPIFLAVRDLALQKRSLRQAIRDLLRSFGIHSEEAVFRKLFERGDVVLILDGLDEADARFQRHIVRQLSLIRDGYPKAIICVSARPHSLDFGMVGFEKWETLPLTLEERVAIARTWFNAVDAAKGDRFLRDCAREPGLLDMGSNPLLLCIVCALYHNDLRIPSEPEELYARMVEGLLGGWDAFRNVARDSALGNLSHHRRMLLVSMLAGMLFERSMRVFTAADVEQLGIIAVMSRRLRSTLPDAQQMLKALYNDFGLLVERAPGRYSFSHLTLQEYLAARHIVDQRREHDIISLALNNRLHELMGLIARLSPDATPFVRRLMAGVDPRRDGDISVALRVWRARPMVDSNVARDAVEALLSRASAALRQLEATYTLDEDLLTATIVGGKGKVAERPDDAEALAVLQNVPHLLEIAALAGVSLVDNPWRAALPFTLIKEGGEVRRVVVRVLER